MSDLIEEKFEDPDLMLEFNAFLGTDFAQSVCAELGGPEDGGRAVVGQIFLKGYSAAVGNMKERLKEQYNKNAYTPPKA